jgi:hypothetical protein
MSFIHFVVEVLVQVVSGIALRVGEVVFKRASKHKAIPTNGSDRRRCNNGGHGKVFL